MLISSIAIRLSCFNFGFLKRLWLVETSPLPAILDVSNRPVGAPHLPDDILECHEPPQLEHHSLEAVSVRSSGRCKGHRNNMSAVAATALDAWHLSRHNHRMQPYRISMSHAWDESTSDDVRAVAVWVT